MGPSSAPGYMGRSGWPENLIEWMRGLESRSAPKQRKLAVRPSCSDVNTNATAHLLGLRRSRYGHGHGHDPSYGHLNDMVRTMSRNSSRRSGRSMYGSSSTTMSLRGECVCDSDNPPYLQSTVIAVVKVHVTVRKETTTFAPW